MIKFNQTYYDKTHTQAVNDALLDGTDYLRRAREQLSQLLHNDHIFLSCNGSSAIDMGLFLLDLPRESEIILPSFTFPSAANTVLRMGYRPVFADIDPQTLVMDIHDVKCKITGRTAAIIPTHYGSTSMDMDALRALAQSHEIALLEDAATALGGMYKERMLGTLGDVGIVSFHRTKNVSAEEGGALIVNNLRLIERAYTVYHNGTDHEAFVRGHVPYYTWQEAGTNIAMGNVTAAVLDASLQSRTHTQAVREAVYTIYQSSLPHIAASRGWQLPATLGYNHSNHHVFYLIAHDSAQRDHIQHTLRNQGIQAHTHYMPLHLSAMGQRLGYHTGDLPHTERISESLLRLPLHNCMTPDDAHRVVDALERIR